MAGRIKKDSCRFLSLQEGLDCRLYRGTSQVDLNLDELGIGNLVNSEISRNSVFSCGEFGAKFGCVQIRD